MPPKAWARLPRSQEQGSGTLLQTDGVEVIAGAAQCVPLLAQRVFHDDLAPVGPDQQELSRVPRRPFREQGKPLLAVHGDAVGEAARGGEQDEGAGVVLVLGLLDAEDDPSGLWVPIRFGATDQGRRRVE